MGMNKRIWHSGPPPHIGWWNASTMKAPDIWRWFNGERFSIPCSPDEPIHLLNIRAKEPAYTTKPRPMEWTNYWPENARVPRIKP